MGAKTKGLDDLKGLVCRKRLVCGKFLVGFRHKKTALGARSRTVGLQAERHRGRAGAAVTGRRRDRFVVMSVDMMEAGRAVNDALSPSM